MPSAIIYLDEKEDKKIIEFHKKWGLSKHETIKKMIREYVERRPNN